MVRSWRGISMGLLLACLELAGWAAPAAPGPFVVSVSAAGDDRAAGTPEAPVANLSTALARVRARGSRPGGTVIRLAAGIYRLPDTLELEAGDSGAPGAPLAIEGPSTGEARLTGAREVTGLSPLPAAAYPPRVPSAARGHLWAVHLDPKAWPELPGLVSTGFGRSLSPHGVELLFQRQVLPLAGWPDQGYATLTQVDRNDPGHIFTFADTGHLAGWSQEPDLWAYGYWNQDWRDSYERVAGVNAAAGHIRLMAPGPLGGMAAGQRFRVLNALSELDHPGEWYLDRTSRILYLWPPSPPKAGDVELTILPVLIRAKGVRNVAIRRLTLDGTRTTALSLQGVHSVSVEGCRFENIGGAAVDLVGQASRVENCQIRDTGEGGIYLTGGDRQTLTPGGLVARGDRIARFNRWGRCYRPAIQLNGVGNTAASNDIQEGTQAGILFYGNDHRVICNTLSRLCLETGDAGAIYSGQDWTARGCVIERNRITDVWGTRLKPVAGIYLDDELSGTLVRENLLVHVQVGILVGGGRDNLVQGNWFERCGMPIFVDGRGLTWQKGWVADPISPIRKNLAGVPFQGPAYRKYPGIATVLTEHPGAPVGTRVEGNRTAGPFVMDLRPEATPWVHPEDNRNGGRVPKGFPGGCTPLDQATR